ncbi:MAG: tetratricopeptide repeat protein [Pirellulaceae bacterium]
MSLATTAPGAEITDAIELLHTGQYDACREHCHAAIEAGEYSETWRLVKIQAELAAGRYLDSLATLDVALQLYTTSVRLRWWGVTVCRFAGDDARAQRLLQEIDQLVSGNPWRYSDPANRVTLGRYYLQRGIDPKQVLDATFHAAKKQQPDYAEAYLAAGQLALEKHDYALAAEELTKALKVDATDPDIRYGLAQAFSSSDDEKATEHLQAALARNPRHVDSLLLTVDSHIDAERYEEARELIRQVLLVNPLEPRAWAYRAVVAHLHSDARDEYLAHSMALAWWTSSPEVDYLIGRKLSHKYRFREGAARQKQALARDPHFLPAKVQLSEDLLRLGDEVEGWRLAQEVFDADAYNVVAHNLTTLRDHLSKFRTLSTEGFVVLMDPREADIYGERVLQLLRRARQTLLPKYDVELPRPTLVEIFPEQQDFAIRTFGLPGGDGFLGVCFGDVITANSPASRGEHPVSWESLLWHEFCHVVTLNKTQNKMPRWLSEGISVYEERQADPSWGEAMTPAYRTMILGTDLTPVSQLSGAFLHAPSPMHLQFAYYESSLVVEYLVEKYGAETLQRILVDLGAGMPINESLQRYTGSLAALDEEFAEYARGIARRFGPQADWSKPDLDPDASLAERAEWLREHPANVIALEQQAAALLRAADWRAAETVLKRKVELLPSDESALEHLAEVYRNLKETDEELAVLERWAKLSSDAVPAYVRLVELYAAREDWQGVQRAANRLLASNPLLPAPHRALAQAAEATGDDVLAISALRTNLRMAPLDEVGLHFRLARLLRKQGDLPAAKRHILQALEDAPRFREAYDTFREIVAAQSQVSTPPSQASPAVELKPGGEPAIPEPRNAQTTRPEPDSKAAGSQAKPAVRKGK